MPKILERVAKLEQENISQNNLIETICSDINDIKETLLSRPSWSVSLVLTALSTICCGLIVYIVT